MQCLYQDGRFYHPICPYLEECSLDKSIILAIRARRMQELSIDINGANVNDETTIDNNEMTQDGKFRCKLIGHANVGSVSRK